MCNYIIFKIKKEREGKIMIARKKSKIMVLILTLTLLLSMGGVANAAEPRNIEEGSTTSITINGVENIGTVTAYKVIDVNFDTENQQPVDPVYTWDANVAAWLRNPDNVNVYGSYVEIIANDEEDLDDDVYVVTETFRNLKNQEDGAAKIKKFVDDLASAIKSGDVNVEVDSSGDWTDSTDSTDGSYEFKEMEMGAYLILVTGGVKIYSPIFTNVYPSFNEELGEWELAAPEVSVTAKSEIPGLVKEVDDPTVAIGDTVKYTLTIAVPQYPDNALDKRFAFGDRLPDGLSLVNDSVKIYAGSTEDVDNEITGYFAATEELDEGVTFEYYANTYDALMQAHPDLTTILVTYNAAVDSDAYNYKDGMENTAYLEYDNDPYDDTGYRTITDNEIVYTYALEITKRDDDGEEVVYLPGAEFTLKRHDPEGTMKFVKESDGIYHVAAQDEANTDVAVDRVVSNSDGIIQIKGLDVGTYTLTEVKAPDGYTLPSNPNTTITLSEGKKPDGTLDSIEADGTKVIKGSVGVDGTDDNQGNVGISNSTSDFDLPQTGGIGTVIFTVAGILIMSGAVILLVTASKKKSNHK